MEVAKRLMISWLRMAKGAIRWVKKITTKKKTARKKTNSQKDKNSTKKPAIKKAVTKPAEEETLLSKVKNVVDDTAAKIKTLLPTGTTTDKESDQPKTK
jgi:hypothetical protein